MASLSHKVRTAMDESRMLILGAQVLLGFQFRAPFEPMFASLPRTSQYLTLVALGLSLISIALIMSPGAYHRIVWQGNDSTDIHDFTTRVMDIALLPFLIALSIEFYAVIGKLAGTTGGMLGGVFIGASALSFWYGPAITRQRNQTRRKNRAGNKMKSTPLEDRIEQVLTEARVVLPGVQALLGFQLATMLMQGFDSLPQSSKYIHLISLLLIGLCVVLLMTPAAYHRIVDRGEDTESFHRIASALLLLAMVPLPLGIGGEFFVALRKISGSVSVSVVSTVLLLGFFYGLWFAFPSFRRTQMTRARQ